MCIYMYMHLIDQYFFIARDIVMTRFGLWKEIIDLDNDNVNINEELYEFTEKNSNTRLLRNRQLGSVLTDAPPYVQALHMYTKTLAFINTGCVEKGRVELNRLIELVAQIPKNPLPSNHPFYPNHKEMGELMVKITSSSMILKKKGNAKEAISLLKNATDTQDNFLYMEPEFFYLPLRHCLGKHVCLDLCMFRYVCVRMYIHICMCI
jgi:hypothetical protein